MTRADDVDPLEARQRSDLVVAAAFGIAAVLIAGVAMQAFGPAMNDPDSMASVLYFQRIAAGQQLEVYTLTTPKPLLTAFYGVTWNLFHDWRAIVWETLLVHGVGVGMAVLLATRLAGVAAGSFIGVFLILSSPHLLEVSQANSLVWALAGWLLAGLAVTAAPPRFGLAGLGLLLAATARLETFIVLAAATAAIALLGVLELAGRAPGVAISARRTLPLLLGWLALPILLLHDFLLIGNPLYWLSMPAAYTAIARPGLRPMPLDAYLGELGEQYSDDRLLIVLAVVGVGFLIRRRRWSVLIGLVSLTFGVFALLTSLALRGLFIDGRYYEQPGLAMAFAAAIGVGWLVGLTARALGRRLGLRALPAGAAPAGAAVAGLLAVVLSSFPVAPFNDEIAARFDRLRAASANVERLMPELREVLDAADGPPPAAVPGPQGFTLVDPRQTSLFVPRTFQRRVAIEAEALLTRIGDSQVAFRSTPPQDVLVPGQFVYHDANIDVPPEAFAAFETAEPSTLGALRLTPLVADPAAGMWWLAVAAAD